MSKSAWTAAQRNLFLPAAAGFFIAGIWLAPRVATGIWPLYIGLAALLAALPLRMLRLPLRLVCLPLALVLALLWTQVWLHPIIPVQGRYETITATVYGDAKVTAAGNTTFTAADVVLDGKAQPGKAYAYLYSEYDAAPPVLTDGMRVRFSGKVYQPYPKANAFDFDFTLWMYESGLRYGINGIENLEILPEETHWTSFAQRITAVCYEKLSGVMGERADLAVAMLLGQRGALSEDDTLAFQRAGVAHLMAVSGLHVGILSMALLWLLRRLRLRRTLQIPVLAVFLLLYCGITGFAVSTMRAGVMVLLWGLAGTAGRKPNPITTVSAALLIVLMINPLQLFTAGFTLSFAAVGGIVLLYPRLQRWLDKRLPLQYKKKDGRLRRSAVWLLIRSKQMLAVTLAAQAGVLLPIAAYFHNVYPYGIVFNLLIVPLAFVLVPLYAVTLLVLLVPLVGGVLGMVLGAAAGFLSSAVLGLVRVSHTLPLAQIRVPQPTVWVVLAAIVAAVSVSHFIRADARRRLLAVAAAIAVAVTGSYLTRPPALRYHQFAVGWADAAMIVDHEITIGIDTGNTGSQIINRLLGEGRDLDALILSHLHADHAGGVDAILDAGIRIGHVYLPVDYGQHGYAEDTLQILARLQQEGVPVTTLAAGDTLRYHETTIDVLWPQAGRTREGIDPNDRSLALLITLGGVRILSMADNGMLYERYAAVPADILKTGHHGSRSSSADSFLQAVHPSLALFTVREDTNLPAPSTAARFAAQDIRMLRTDETGEITIVPVAGGYRAYRYIPEVLH